MTNKMNMKVIMPGDPGFKESLESGKCISGADIQALWHAWNAGEIPDPADGDEVVQPKSQPNGRKKNDLGR
jgi:hypothetical protein